MLSFFFYIYVYYYYTTNITIVITIFFLFLFPHSSRREEGVKTGAELLPGLSIALPDTDTFGKF